MALKLNESEFLRAVQDLFHSKVNCVYFSLGWHASFAA